MSPSLNEPRGLSGFRAKNPLIRNLWNREGLGLLGFPSIRLVQPRLLRLPMWTSPKAPWFIFLIMLCRSVSSTSPRKTIFGRCRRSLAFRWVQVHGHFSMSGDGQTIFHRPISRRSSAVRLFQKKQPEQGQSISKPAARNVTTSVMFDG